ncbi:MAG: ABC transporter permease [Candidatus Acidiferrales bacterium]
MHKIWLVIKREYITRVKSKGFLIGTIIVPVLGIGFALLTAFLATRQPNHTFRLAVLDESGILAPTIQANLNSKLPDGEPEFSIVQTVLRPTSPGTVQENLRSQVNAGTLDGYLQIPSDLTAPLEMHMRNPDNLRLIGTLTAAVNQAIVLARLQQRGIHVDDPGAVFRSTDLKLIKVTRNGEAVERGQTIGISIALVMLLYMALLMYGIITMRSVLEEKTTRTMESLISTVRPSQLLAGKILGVAGVAFTQFLIWLATFALIFSYGALMSTMTPGSPLAGVHIPISLLIYALIFFVCGYFLYASLYAAVGAACSNEQDAQQLQWPATLPLIFSVVMFSAVLSDPASKVSVILSEIPLFAPILMTLRISVQTPPFWQIALSIALLLLGIVGVVYVSARIYRVGILMYGKRPNLPELLRWLRYS